MLQKDRLRKHLSQIDRHIERLGVTVARQERIVAELFESGRRELAMDAANLLDRFQRLQQGWMVERQRVLWELELVDLAR